MQTGGNFWNWSTGPVLREKAAAKHLQLHLWGVWARRQLRSESPPWQCVARWAHSNSASCNCHAAFPIEENNGLGHARCLNASQMKMSPLIHCTFPSMRTSVNFNEPLVSPSSPDTACHTLLHDCSHWSLWNVLRNKWRFQPDTCTST